MRRSLLLVLLAVFLAPPPPRLLAQDAAFDFEADQTTIGWTLGDVLHTVHGTFQLKRGSIRFDPETGKAAGEIVVDVASGESGSPKRDRRMHKAILESMKYPEAIFTPESVEGRLNPEGESTLTVHGQFKIHGAGHQLSLEVKAERKGDRLIAATRLDLPYVKWGMKNPSTFLLRVNDHVEMDIRLVGHAHSER